jgi:hypothetical protein
LFLNDKQEVFATDLRQEFVRENEVELPFCKDFRCKDGSRTKALYTLQRIVQAKSYGDEATED